MFFFLFFFCFFFFFFFFFCSENCHHRHFHSRHGRHISTDAETTSFVVCIDIVIVSVMEKDTSSLYYHRHHLSTKKRLVFSLFIACVSLSLCVCITSSPLLQTANRSTYISICTHIFSHRHTYILSQPLSLLSLYLSTNLYLSLSGTAYIHTYIHTYIHLLSRIHDNCCSFSIFCAAWDLNFCFLLIVPLVLLSGRAHGTVKRRRL